MLKAFISDTRADLMLVFLVLLALAGSPSSHSLEAADPATGLRYRWKSNNDYAYSLELEAEVRNEIRSIRGKTMFTAKQLAPAEIPSGETSQGTGTGFFVTSDGYFVTCEHVVKKASKILVNLGGKEYVGRTIAVSKEHDLAIAKIEGQNLPVLPLGDSQRVELAQEVRVVGFPLSDVLGNSIKITRGTVAGIMNDRGGKLQVDASINPGNSGGPLVNEQGEVVGIASAKLTGEAVSNVGFAVPASEARKLLTAHGIKFQTIGAPARLEGPELAKRVIPAVALVTVTSGGTAPGDHYRLTFRHRFETSKFPKNDPKATASSVRNESGGGANYLVNQYGESVQMSGQKVLPFGVGVLEQVLIDNLSAEGAAKWEIDRAASVPITESQPNPAAGARFGPGMPGRPGGPFGPGGPGGPFGPGAPGGPGRFGPPQPTNTILVPALETMNYEITSGPGDRLVTIKKRTDLEAAHKPGEKPALRLVGTSTIKFDKAQGVTESIDFQGTFNVTTDSESVDVPLKYSFKQIPASTFNDPIPPRAGGPVQVAQNPRPAPGPAAPAPVTPRPGSGAPMPTTSGNEPTVKLEIQADDPPTKAEPVRKPVPSIDAIKSGKAIVLEVFGSEITAAKTASKKLPVIKKMLDSARQEAGAPPAETYALLDHARELAVSAGDVSLAIQAIDALDANFKIDGGAMKSQALTTISEAATTTLQNKAVASAALGVFEQALVMDDLNTARTAGGIALNAARKAKDDALVKTITERAKYFKAKQAAYEKVPAALATLQAKPDDAAANLTVGRYYCFVQENWRRGLPLLALCSDAPLKQLAKLELEGDQAYEVRVQVADSWWQRGEEELDFKAALQAHAATIYRDALPSVGGLTKIKIEKRLEAVAATAAAAPAVAAAGGGSPSAPSTAADRDAMWKNIQEQVKANQVSRTKEAGFTLGKTPYAVIPEDGAMLIGFDLSIGGRGIEAVCPLFQRRGGNLAGAVIGKPTPGQILRVMAKKGYAVASIKVKAGLWIDGLSVTFMEIKGQGLDPSTAYTSPWYGSDGGSEAVLGDSTIVVGIHGHGKPGELNAIGLVQLGSGG